MSATLSKRMVWTGVIAVGLVTAALVPFIAQAEDVIVEGPRTKVTFQQSILVCKGHFNTLSKEFGLNHVSSWIDSDRSGVESSGNSYAVYYDYHGLTKNGLREAGLFYCEIGMGGDLKRLDATHKASRISITSSSF